MAILVVLSAVSGVVDLGVPLNVGLTFVAYEVKLDLTNAVVAIFVELSVVRCVVDFR